MSIGIGATPWQSAYIRKAASVKLSRSLEFFLENLCLLHMALKPAAVPKNTRFQVKDRCFASNLIHPRAPPHYPTGPLKILVRYYTMLGRDLRTTSTF